MTYSTLNAPARVAAFALLVITLAPHALRAQRPVELAPNAPADKPIDANQCRYEELLKATAPYVERAQASLPGALARYRAGLPKGQTLFITTRLSDSLGRHEQVFVVVDSASSTEILGRIWSPVEMLRGYRLRQPIAVRMADVVDWTISMPDGSEDGNEVGKFLDTYRPKDSCNSPGRSS